MKKNIIKIIAIAILFNGHLAFTKNGPKYPEGFRTKTTRGVCFTENKGQVHDQNYKSRLDVLYSGTDGDLVFHLRNNGISYQLNRVDSWKEIKVERISEKRKEIDKSTIYRLDLNWLNANTNSNVIKGKAYQGFNNYYLENCPSGALNVQSFENVTYENIYNGIDLKWYQKEGHLKYDYMVAAGANYKQIQIEINGAEKITLSNKGELILKTPLGIIVEQAPLVIQNGKILKSKWLIKNATLSFDIETLNPNQPFVIDPAVRLWGTYYGYTFNDFAYSCTTDANGNVYLTGATPANTGTIIATIGAHQSVNGGGNEAYLVKFDALGVRQWGTYYGGTGNENGLSCATDQSSNVYLVGNTNSNIGTVIATAGVHQSVSGGMQDAFLVKFDALGVRQWGTYYGGAGNDYAQKCTTDANNNVYLTGYTNSNIGTIIATAGAHQSINGGINDAYLVKFDAVGVRQWGTYYGGTGDEIGFSCATDATGNVYLSGDTDSNTGTVIATAGSHQTIHGGGGTDAFLVKFDAAGIRQWGSYYGGAGYESGRGCAIDAIGNVFLAGYTTSNAGTVIVTTGAHQSIHGGGIQDAFLAKFNASGLRQWGTYYGGVGAEFGHSCTTDAASNVYLAGEVDSNTSGIVIATAGAHQPLNGGGFDAFLVKFDPLGVRQWGTYYGGNTGDQGRSCVADATGNIYLAGYTTSNTGTAIATTGSHQAINGGNTDGFLVKLADCSPTNPTGPNVIGCANNAITLTATSGTATINWYATPSSTTVLGTGTAYITPTLSANTYTYYAEAFTCASSATRAAITLTVNANPTLTVGNGSICSGQSYTMVPSGANTYTFQGGSAIVSPTTNTSYTVVGTSTVGCVSQIFATSNVTVNITPTINVNSGSICSGNSFTIVPSGANTYTIQSGFTVVSPTANISYTVVGTGTNGCVSVSSATSIVTVNPNPTVTTVSNSSLLCVGQNATLIAIGANAYTFNPGGTTSSSIVISPTITTTYTLNGIDLNGCSNSSTITQSVSACTSIDQITNTISELNIYPNPFINKITVITNGSKQILQIFNALGSLVFNTTIETENLPAGVLAKVGVEIDVTQLPAGIYFVRTGTVTKKLIKE